RRPGTPRNHGEHGQPQSARPRHSPADFFRPSPRSPALALVRRYAQGLEHRRDHRHRRRCGVHAGTVQLRAPGPDRKRRREGPLPRPRHPPALRRTFGRRWPKNESRLDGRRDGHLTKDCTHGTSHCSHLRRGGRPGVWLGHVVGPPRPSHRAAQGAAGADSASGEAPASPQPSFDPGRSHERDPGPQPLARPDGRGTALRNWLRQAGMGMRPGKFVLLSAGLGLIGGMFGLVWLPWYGMLAAGGPAALLPYAWAKRQRSKRLATFETQFPEAIDLLVRASRAGHPPGAALELIANEMPEPA